MSNLQGALQYVKQGVHYDGQGDSIKALKNYKFAIGHFQKSLDNKELYTQHLREELQRELNYYQNKIIHIQKKLQLKTFPMNSELNEQCEDESKLIKRIESTIMCEKPNVKLCDVSGLDKEKALLRQAVVLPIKHPEIFQNGFNPYKAFLFFGPPGTGKSFLAKAVAGEVPSTTFFTASVSDLVSKYQGESESLIKILFKLARQRKPSIIFIDEIDSLALARSENDNDGSRRIKSELLIQIDGSISNNQGVFLMAATNTPDNLDDAFLRRFDKLIYVPLPSIEARKDMLTKNFANCPEITPEIIIDLAKKTEGLSGSDIAILTKKAKMLSVVRVQQAMYFKKEILNGENVYTPCDENNSEAEQMSLDEVPTGGLNFVPVATKDDAIKTISQAKSRIDRAKIRKMEKFAEENGEIVANQENVRDNKLSKTTKFLNFLLSFLF